MFRIVRRVLFLVCLFALVVTNLPGQYGVGTHAGLAVQSEPATPPASGKQSVSPDYRIGRGDVLQISVWGEAELTKTVTVRPDGKISLPLINEVRIAGLTSPDAQTLLNQRFSQYIRNPQTSVIVAEIHSNLVYVTGRVRRPGAYPIAGSLNVVQLIARAGGLADHAKQKHIYILRQASGSRINLNYKDVIQGRRGSHDIELLPGDTVVVP
ncbi:MAG TPA: polysaccharide biosynthesis/export family protein [Granulicella sp.]|nr:polysaccharide biosynthesis/export family protein [Granulicella sp.]